MVLPGVGFASRPNESPTSRRRQQPRYADQFVGGHHEGEQICVARHVAQLGLNNRGDRLRLTECFVEQLPHALADGMALVLRRATAERNRLAVFVIASFLATCVVTACSSGQLADEVCCVVVLVSAEHQVLAGAVPLACPRCACPKSPLSFSIVTCPMKQSYPLPLRNGFASGLAC